MKDEEYREQMNELMRLAAELAECDEAIRRRDEELEAHYERVLAQIIERKTK